MISIIYVILFECKLFSECTSIASHYSTPYLSNVSIQVLPVLVLFEILGFLKWKLQYV